MESFIGLFFPSFSQESFANQETSDSITLTILCLTEDESIVLYT